MLFIICEVTEKAVGLILTYVAQTKHLHFFGNKCVDLFSSLFFLFIIVFSCAIMCVLFLFPVHRGDIFYYTSSFIVNRYIFYIIFYIGWCIHYHDNSLSISPLPPVEYSDVGVTKLFEKELVSEF